MDSGRTTPKEYPNVPPLLAFLVSQKVCTLNELRSVYSFEDALWMYEAVMVPKYNEWKELEANKKDGRR